MAVAGCRTLLPSRHAASPGLGCLRPAIAVSSAVAVVAAVRFQLSRRHRLGAALSHHGGVAAIARRHRADACARSSRQVSARFRRTAGRTHQFAPAPLHFTAISQATFPFHSFRRPQTAETVKDSGAPKDARGRDAPHIGQDRQYGRATSSGQEISITARGSACRRRQSNSTARLRPVQDAAITVRSAISAPPPFRKLHCSGQKQPNSLLKPHWSDTTAAGCGQVCRARPCTHRVAAHALRSAVVESVKWRSRWRDCAGKRDPAKCCLLCSGVGMREQPTLRFSLRCEAGCRLCYPGSRTRDVICNAAHCRIPLAREPSANGFPPSPRATTRPTARFIKDNIVLCGTAGCFPVTLTANPHLRARAGSHRASSQTSLMPTPPRRESF